jgi:hypothetical protein
MGTRKQVFAGITKLLNDAEVEGYPFTKKQVSSALKDAPVQAAADEWEDASSGGVSRWRRSYGSDSWYVSEATASDGSQRLVELHTTSAVSAAATSWISVYREGGTKFGSASPLDGYRNISTESVTADVSTDDLAWSVLATRIAAGVA